MQFTGGITYKLLYISFDASTERCNMTLKRSSTLLLTVNEAMGASRLINSATEIIFYQYFQRKLNNRKNMEFQNQWPCPLLLSSIVYFSFVLLLVLLSLLIYFFRTLLLYILLLLYIILILLLFL